MQSSSGMFGRDGGGDEYGSLSRLLQGVDSSDSPQWTPSNGNNALAATVRQPARKRNELAVIENENLKLVPELQLATYVKMRQFWDSAGSSVSRLTTIPTAEAMNVFIQLYFEHYHPNFPLLHMPTFQPREDMWLLVFSIAAIGAEYSELCTQELMDWFEQLAKKAISYIVSATLLLER